MQFLRRHWLAILISLLLFTVPFFWFPPGTVDLGGDGGRLYFYDPVHLVQHLGPYYLWPQDGGFVAAPFSRLPFFSLIAAASYIISDMRTLASLHNGAKLATGFLSVYAMIRLFLTGDQHVGASLALAIGAILGALLYLFNPAMTENYVRALPSHDQVFLNPLMTYLVLLFLLSGKMRFALLATAVSVMFAHVYSYTSAPPVFAFYPLAALFTIGYVAWVRGKSIEWGRVVLFLLIFFGAHAFHLVPELFDLLDASNRTTSRVFNTSDAAEQLNYFVSVLPIPKVSLRWLAASPWMPGIAGSAAVPLMVVCGFLLARRPRRTLTLAGLFVLITLYLSTAKVSDAAVELYKQFFLYIPGFSMFRNFYGQWQFAFFFFYAILFGLAAGSILVRLGKRLTVVISVFVATFLIVRAIPFLDGTMVNQKNHLSETKVAVAMDPQVAQMLSYIRALPKDGKILTLPFTDCCYQVIHGTNNGAYVGKSFTGYLTGKHDFSGYDTMLPYSDTFWRLAKMNDYEGINKLLGMLNIRYILHNSDPKAYDTTFPSYPYEYVRKYLPQDQESYRLFIDRLAVTPVYSVGTFTLYQTQDTAYLPLWFATTSVRRYKDEPRFSEYAKAEAFFDPKMSDLRQVYIEQNSCILRDGTDICALTSQTPAPAVSYHQIDPTKYRVSVTGATEPYLLVMLMRYNAGWKVSLDGNPVLQLDSTHIPVNGYANAWYIRPEDVGMKNSYELIVELDQQRLFTTGLTITLATAVASLIIGAFVYAGNRKNHPSSI